MGFIFLLLFLLLFTGTTCVLFKKSFGKCLPISFILPSLILYLSGILTKNLLVGYILNGLYMLVFPAYIVYMIVKKKSLNELKKNYLSNGLYLFLILYTIISFINIGKKLERWDEFGFWGYVAKWMFNNDKICINITGVDSATMTSHPPLILLWEVFVCKLNGGYSESYLNIAIQLFEFMFIIPFISEIKIKDTKLNFVLKGIIAIVGIMLMIYALDFTKTSTTTYVDVYMMLYFAYCFGTAVLSKKYLDKFFIFNMSISISGLLLNKQIVLALFLVIIFYMLLRYMIDNKWKLKINKKLVFSGLKMFVFIVLIPLVIYKSWSIYIMSFDSSFKTQTSGIISGIMSFNTSTELGQTRLTIMNNYIRALANETIYSGNFIQTTYVGNFFIVLSLLIILKHFFKKEFTDNSFISLFWSFVVAMVGYAFTFLILYTFGVFSTEEGLAIASYSRYASTFMLALYFVIFAVGMDILRQKKINYFSYKKLFIILTVIILITPNINFFNFSPGIFKNDPANNKFEVAGNIIKEVIDEENPSIYFVSNIYETPVYVRYYANIENVNRKYIVGLEFIESESQNVNEDFIEYLKDFDYVYVFDNYDYFNDNFSYLFPNGIIENGKIYKININDNNIVLELKS